MRESLKSKKERALLIYKIFEQEYDSGECTLDYDNALQLLIATQLAAQCTDARVNLVTPALFAKYPDVYAFANADELELREDIRSTGFYKNKARNIIGCCKRLIEVYGGEVPNTMEDLLSLPGVGRKTANLLLGEFSVFPELLLIPTRRAFQTVWALLKTVTPIKSSSTSRKFCRLKSGQASATVLFTTAENTVWHAHPDATNALFHIFAHINKFWNNTVAFVIPYQYGFSGAFFGKRRFF